MNSFLKPRLPWRLAALIAGAVLAAVLAVAPAHASQAQGQGRPALAGKGVINADGIQGSGASLIW